MSTVGFVGLGSMAPPIADRLQQGNIVYGTNRTRAKDGPDGILAGLRPESVYVEMSTVSPHAPLVLDLPEQAWFDVQLMHKDIRLALEAARRTGIPLPAASAADSALSWAEDLGYGHRDIASLYQVLDRAPASGAAA
jgi:3-hydroxyisobutyrate dehydrogenase-like beta-hydroxyacid dehydrogenase